MGIGSSLPNALEAAGNTSSEMYIRAKALALGKLVEWVMKPHNVRLLFAVISQRQQRCCKELLGGLLALDQACLMPVLWRGCTSRWK